MSLDKIHDLEAKRGFIFSTHKWQKDSSKDNEVLEEYTNYLRILKTAQETCSLIELSKGKNKKQLIETFKGKEQTLKAILHKINTLTTK